MGIMDAIGGGIEQAAQGVANTATAQIQSQIEQDRQSALLQMKQTLDQQTHQANATFDQDQAEALRAKRAAQVQDIIKQKADAAGLAVPGTVQTRPQDVSDQADKAANAYVAAHERGDISEDQMKQGLMGATAYSNDNATTTDNSAAQDAARKKVSDDPETMAKALDAMGDHDGAYKIRAGMASGAKGEAAMAKVDMLQNYFRDKIESNERINDAKDETNRAKLEAATAKGANKPADVATADALTAHANDPTWLENWQKSHTNKDKTGMQFFPDSMGNGGGTMVDHDTGAMTSYVITPAREGKPAVVVEQVLRAPTGAAPAASAPKPAKPFNPADYQKK